MSDTAPINAAPPPYAGAREDRLMPAVVYGLYLIGVGHLTIIIGLLIAYSCRGGAGPVAANHYNYQIRTFWLSIWWFIIGAGLFLIGLPLSIILIGLPMIFVGASICGFVWLYVIIRAVIGLVYLLQDEPHPRPEGWLF